MANLGEIEKHFKFRTDFYKVAEIIPSPENNQLVDEYRKIRKVSGEKAGLIYKDGWKNPSEINEEGFASLNGINYLYYVWDISRLQAEIMQELQDKIDEARGKIDTSAPEDRTSLLRELQNFNEQWVEESENESIKKARKGALVQKKSRLENVIGELFGREIQSIWDDMLNEDKYNKAWIQLEGLVGNRIRILDEKYTDKEGRNKHELEKIKETIKDRLKFRADFLSVAGEREERTTISHEGEVWEATGKRKVEFSDEFIYDYQNKGFNGVQAGKVYLNGWTEPRSITADGYFALKATKSGKNYYFLVLTTTFEEAEEKIKQEEELLRLIDRPETENELEKLKSDLGKLEEFISQIDLVDISTLNPVEHAYWKNKEATDSKREKLVEAINNLQRQSLISKIEIAVQKINDSIKGRGVELIENESTSRRLSDWKELINNKDISLEETEKKIREELTVEVCALLSDRLEYLCQIAQIEYREIGIETNIRSYFFIENYELDELAVKGSEIARRIIDIRSGHESDAVQNSIGTLKELINKEKSGDLETLHSDLRRLQDLIPVTEEGKTVANRQLTSAEIEAYRQNKKTADEKELELRKEIFRKEESSLGEERWNKINKANNRDEFLKIERQLNYERNVEKILESCKERLEDKNITKDELLITISGLKRNDKSNSEGEWGKIFRGKGKEIKQVIRSLKKKIAEFEFAEYIEIINGENDLLAIDKIKEDWSNYLAQEGLIDNRDMPEGKKVKDLVEVIERRKKEIVERKPSQKKSEAEKLNKIGKEAVFFQKQLAERDIILEEDSWANRVLEIIDDKKAMEEKVKQAEGILGLQLKNLEESSPPLTNLSETVNLLPKIGINLKKGENGRNYYDAESLSNKLTELIRKEEENNSLRETIKTKGEEIEQLKNDLDVVKGEKESLTIFFSKKGKDVEDSKKENEEMQRQLWQKENELKAEKEKVAGWEKKNKELTNSLSNAQKEVEDLQKIIAENANIANKEEQEDLEAIARNLGIEEREVKDKPVEEIQKIIKEKAEQLQRVKNKVEELPNLINADGKVSDDKLEKLKKLIENRENTAKRISELESKVKQAQTFGLTNWDDLTAQTQNETLTSLLNRPKSSELEAAAKARDAAQADLATERTNHQNTQQTLKTWTDRFGTENATEAANKLEDTAKKLSEAEKVLTDEQTEHEKTKTALNAANQDKDKANQIVDEAKEALGVEDLEDDLLDKLNGDSLPEIIEQRDKANTAKLEAEAQWDKVNQALNKWKEKFGDDIAAAETEKNQTNANLNKANKIIDEWKDKTGTTNPEAAKTKIESLDQAAREANAAQAKVEAEKTAAERERDTHQNDLDKWANEFGTDQAATAKTRLDQAEKDRDAYLAALNKAQDKQDKQDKLNNLIDPKDLDQKIKEVRTEYEGFINPKNITPVDQNTLRGVGYVPATDYQGWIDPNHKKTRQEAGLKTEDEVNVELDKIAHQLGLGNHNDLTDINLANLQAAEKERNNARRSLRTDNLNTLPPIPAGETLQTLLERPTQPELVEAVNNARQQEAEKYTNHIDPPNLVANWFCKFSNCFWAV